MVLATEGHCDWEDMTTETFEKLGVPFHRFNQDELSLRFPQFDMTGVKYGLYEPEAGMIMAHRSVISAVNLFRKLGGKVARGCVQTDASEQVYLDGKLITNDLIIISTGSWMGEMFPRTIGPLSNVIGLNVLYTSTPEGTTQFDHDFMPCWIDHGHGSFGMPSVEGHGIKAMTVIPDSIDLDNDERLIRQDTLHKTRRYIETRLPGLVGQKVVDSKFNQITMTPDTHFIIDWHPEHKNILFAGGCSGHLFKHGPVFGDFVAGVGLREYGSEARFRLGKRTKPSPKDSPSGR